MPLQRLVYVKSIMAVLERQLTQSPLLVMCEGHPDLVAEFYCEMDCEYLCYKCALLSHKSHDIKDAKEVSLEAKV